MAEGRAARASALGDSTRLQILSALRDGGELCVCDLAWIMERSDALVSHHLRVLRTAGLVASRRDGKMVMYRLVGQGALLLGVLIPVEKQCRRERGSAHPDPAGATLPVLDPSERARLERRAKLLAWGGNAWHLVEFAIAVGAGMAAGSVALVAFGVDSLIELLAGGVVIWLFSGGRGSSAVAERRAQRLIALSFYLLAGYVVIESLRTFMGAHPEASWVGIGLAAVTAPTMPLLARAKQDVGRRLGSRATESEGAQNMICAYLRGPAGRPRSKRAARLVVGRPAFGARDCRSCVP